MSGAHTGPRFAAPGPTSPIRPLATADPQLAEGVELVGRYQGSGYVEPKYLVRRADGQILHISRLLFLVAANLGNRTPAQIAERVTRQYRRGLSAEGVEFLVERKLRPLGLVAPGPPASSGPPAQLLRLRLRRTLVTPRATAALGKLLSPLFTPLLVVAGLAALAVADVWLLRTTGLIASTEATLDNPAALLAVMAIAMAAAFVHELGHAAACHHGGGRPGAIGVAIYLVYPAFYTDVTDAYRLSRAARVRTDLGGVYFNALSIVLLTALYRTTGWEPLVLAIVLVHIELGQQLLPLARLDGYFVLADAVGVPDLYARVWPVVANVWPGRAPDPRVEQLRRRTRIVVTVWVLTAVPLLFGLFGLLVVRLPAALRGLWGAEQEQWHTLRDAIDTGAWASATLAALSVVMLVLPVLGALLLIGDMARRAIRPLARTAGALATRAMRRREDGVDVRPVVPPPAAVASRASGPLPAAAPPSSRPATGPAAADRPTAEPRPHPHGLPPGRGWRRAVHAVTRGALTPGPGAAERHERAVVERLRTPAAGTRRIVVLSPTDGVGNTTTALMLAHTFAAHRGDRVVALGAHPDAGSLTHPMCPEATRTAGNLLGRGGVDHSPNTGRLTSSPGTCLDVRATDDDPWVSRALGERDWHDALELLDRRYGVVVIDAGTGIRDLGVQGILDEADQLVVVTAPTPDGARAAATTLDWLDGHRWSHLVPGAVTVVNAVPRRGTVDVGRIEAHFERRCAAAVRIPWDRALAAGSRTTLGGLRAPTGRAHLELAATVAEGFVTPCQRAATGPPA